MRTISKYHRPETFDEALALLSRSDVATRLLAGGTLVNTESSLVDVELVDLQAVGSRLIEVVDDRVEFGAMATLQDVVDHQSSPPLLRELATREAPSTIRNVATIGGTVASADPESLFLAGLLVHGAVVALRDPEGSPRLLLNDLLRDPSVLDRRIIESVSIELGGATAWVGTGRTPSDIPIVAAVARRGDGETALALTGLDSAPVLAAPDSLDGFEPVEDFRGSREYRLHLAGVLTRRVLDELGGGR